MGNGERQGYGNGNETIHRGDAERAESAENGNDVGKGTASGGYESNDRHESNDSYGVPQRRERD